VDRRYTGGKYGTDCVSRLRLDEFRCGSALEDPGGVGDPVVQAGTSATGLPASFAGREGYSFEVIRAGRRRGELVSVPRISIAIPYKQRLKNLRMALEGLARQTLPMDCFEVVVGAMEYCSDLYALVEEFAPRLDLVVVMTGRNFAIPRARNVAMRQARGDIVMQMDADTLLGPDALAVVSRRFAFDPDLCVVGQVVGYDNNKDGDVNLLEETPFEEHVARFETLRASQDWPLDPRFRVPHTIPWAFGWTGLIALPRRLVVTHDLFFDEAFAGWGIDDLEWSFRVSRARIPIVLEVDASGLHLPHFRDSIANDAAEAANYEVFLAKWPCPDVELCAAIGDLKANGAWEDYRASVRGVSAGAGLGCVRAGRPGAEVALLGVDLDTDGALLDPATVDALLPGSPSEVLPLTGLRTPWAKGRFVECCVMPAVASLPDVYASAIKAEAARLSASGP
jgi:GT2 family glycosyltransferase